MTCFAGIIYYYRFVVAVYLNLIMLSLLATIILKKETSENIFTCIYLNSPIIHCSFSLMFFGGPQLAFQELSFVFNSRVGLPHRYVYS